MARSQMVPLKIFRTFEDLFWSVRLHLRKRAKATIIVAFFFHKTPTEKSNLFYENKFPFPYGIWAEVKM